MQGPEAFSNLIGDMYDAALDPSLWERVLKKSAGFVGGAGAGLFARNTIYRTANPSYDYGVSPYYRKLYFETYAGFDPMAMAYLVIAVGDVISSSSVVPYDEFIETRFYKEWAGPQGFIDNVMTLLDRTPTSIAGFAVFRHVRDGLADEAARRRMALIAPHMRRAVLIGGIIDLNSAEAANLADTLDGLSAAVVLVTETGRIVHANVSGHHMIAGGDVLRAAEGYLVACDPQANQALREVFAAAGSGDAAVGVKGIAVALASRGGERHVAHILPLTSGARRQTGAGYAAVAAIFVHKAALQAPSSSEMIAKLYKLTPSELRIWLTVVQLGGISETAAALGIGEATVKTHLHRLFTKTGAGSQADLVRLIAGFSNPLIGESE
jgi:DNA-binding CsgD family transcriptional regulator